MDEVLGTHKVTATDCNEQSVISLLQSAPITYSAACVAGRSWPSAERRDVRAAVGLQPSFVLAHLSAVPLGTPVAMALAKCNHTATLGWQEGLRGAGIIDRGHDYHPVQMPRACPGWLAARRQGPIAEHRIADASRDGARPARFLSPGGSSVATSRGRWACGWRSGCASGYICVSARSLPGWCVRVSG